MRGEIAKQQLCKEVFKRALEGGALDATTANGWVESMLVAPHDVVDGMRPSLVRTSDTCSSQLVKIPACFPYAL